MQPAAFACLPGQAFVTSVGFTWVKPSQWSAYLNRTLWRRFPRYRLQHLVAPASEQGWQVNDCIFQALADTLLYQFGFILPADSLYQVYNARGKGLLPGEMVAAMRAVLEPFGFEIDRILVPDAGLRQGLGANAPLAGLEQAQEFAGRPGVGMIHVGGGESHAFFWPAMDPGRFSSPQFRLAVLLKRATPAPQDPPENSALSLLQALSRLLFECLAGEEVNGDLQQARGHLAALLEDTAIQRQPDFLRQADQTLTRVETTLLGLAAPVAPVAEDCAQAYLLETVRRARRVLRRCNPPCEG